MPEMTLGDVMCGTGDSATKAKSEPVSTGIHPELLFDEVATGPYVGLVHRLSQYALSGDPAAAVAGMMLHSLARALSCNLACVVRQSENELVITRHSTRNPISLGADMLWLEDDPILKPFFENGCPVVCESVRQACGDKSFFRSGLSISAFTLLPIKDTESDRCGLLLTWRAEAPSLRPEQLVTLGSIANVVGAVLKRGHLEEDLEHERNSRRRYTKLVAGREVRMAELKSENAKLKDLVIELSSKIGNLEKA